MPAEVIILPFTMNQKALSITGGRNGLPARLMHVPVTLAESINLLSLIR